MNSQSGHIDKVLARSAYLLLCFLFLVGVGHAQVETVREFKRESASFFLDALNFSTDSVDSRLDVYLQVPYEELTFLKDGDRFVARYEVTLTIFSRVNTVVVERNWVETVRVANFEETISPRAYSLIVRSFPLPSSEYVLRAQVRDSESGTLSQLQRPVQIRDFSESALTMSDVMIVRRLTEVNGRKDIVPNISANVGDAPGPFHLFFEVYNRSDLDTLLVQCKVHKPNDKSPKVLAASRLEPISKGRNQIFLRIDTLNLPLGNYDLILEARKPVPLEDRGEEAGTLLALTKRFITVRWAGVPHSITNLDEAVEQMLYIATASELGYVKDAPTLVEKQQRFIEFWKKKDPSPGTEENELMEEYYARVEYANKHFKHYIDGWKTDRGMVFIILGPPSQVERHPFDAYRKPYEIWYYYERNRRFVFVDQTGFGDYRLITPFSDVWQRR